MQSTYMMKDAMTSISMANPGILTEFDFTAIDEMDPSSGDGSTMIYDKELPFRIRFILQRMPCLLPYAAKVLR